MGSTINSSNLSKAQGANKPSARWLGRNTCKRVLDLALYLVACVTAGTGLLLAYRLPHGAGNAGRVVFFGYGRHEWGDIHTWLAYLGIILVVVHLWVELAVACEGGCVKAHLASRRRYPLGAAHRYRLSLFAGGKSGTEQGKRCHSPANRAVISGKKGNCWRSWRETAQGQSQRLPSLRDQRICGRVSYSSCQGANGDCGNSDRCRYARVDCRLRSAFDQRRINSSGRRAARAGGAAALRQMRNASRRTRVRSVCAQTRKKGGKHQRRASRDSYLYRRRDARHV